MLRRVDRGGLPGWAAGSEDWGAAELAEALYTASADITRMQGLLPELSPADRSLPAAPFLAIYRGILTGLDSVKTQHLEVSLAVPSPSFMQDMAESMLANQRTKSTLLLFCVLLLAPLPTAGLWHRTPASWRGVCLRRGTEIVEGVLRHHIGACFAALERCVVDVLCDAAPKLAARGEPASPQAAAAIGPAPAQHPIAEACARCMKMLAEMLGGSLRC